MWRRRDGRSNESETSEFGGPLFPDDPADDQAPDHADDHGSENGDDTDERRLRFGPDDTGPLQHWTAPPTGEIPRLAPTHSQEDADDDDNDDVDVWSTFTTESPVWRDDDPATVTGVMQQVPNDFGAGSEPSGGFERDSSLSGGYDRSTGQTSRTDPSGGYDSLGNHGSDPSSEISTGTSRPYGHAADRGVEASGSVPIPRREPGRITIGTDPSGMTRRQPDPGRRRSGPPRAPDARPGPTRGVAPQTPRDMQSALIAGGVLAAVFIAALMIHELVVLGIVVAILAIAGYEYFGKITEKGYRPAVVVGLVACAITPIAAYNFGERALPMALFLAFVVGAVGFIATRGIESGPLPNMAITTLGVVWIAVLGSYAGLILRLSTGPLLLNGTYLTPGGHAGTDTLLVITLGIAANDIGALVVGSATGKSPLRGMDQPEQDGRRPARRDVGHGDLVVRRQQVARRRVVLVRHVGCAGSRSGDRRVRAAWRPHRVDVQAQPRRQGLWHHRPGPRRRAGSVRRLPLCTSCRLLRDAVVVQGAHGVGRLALRGVR